MADSPTEQAPQSTGEGLTASPPSAANKPDKPSRMPWLPWDIVLGTSVVVCALFAGMFLRDAIRGPVPGGRLDRVEGLLRAQRSQLAALRDCLLAYHERHGRFPTNDEGLGVLIWPDILRAMPEPDAEPEWHTSHYAFFGWEGGVENAWHLPFVYENRAGLAAEAFAHSPVHADEGGLYSLRVADGVYVYSVPAIEHAQERAELLDDHRRWQRQELLLGAALAALALLCLVQLFRMRKWLMGLVGLAVGTGLGVLGTPSVVTTCYMMPPFPHGGRPPTPEMVQRQSDLLAKYYRAGVIQEQTYRKAQAAVDAAADLTFDDPPDTRPASRSSS